MLPWTWPWDSADGTPQGFTNFRENRLPGELSQNLPQAMGRQGEEVGDCLLSADFSLN